MVLSNECWMKDYCSKYLSDLNCDCRIDSVFCSKLFKLDKLYSLSLLSDNQRKHQSLFIDADGSDRNEFIRLKEIEKNIDSWISSGKNLYLYSSICGNGKTSWAVRLLQAYFEKIWYKSDLVCKGLFVNVPRFLIALKNNITAMDEYAIHVKDNILSADLVVWDDVAIKTATTYEMENLLSILDYRLNSNKSNIYTSNLFGQDLNERLGERLYSRIINLSEIIELKGQDKRGLIK